MMQCELKELFSYEIEQSLSNFRPTDPQKFAISLRMMIGPRSTEESDSFDLLVCTPSWMEEECDSEGYVWGYQKLIVTSFDIKKIQGAIQKYCEHCVGEDWLTIARQISLIGQWEFEGYRFAK